MNSKAIRIFTVMVTVLLIGTVSVIPVQADAGYQIMIENDMEYAVFALIFSGEVSGLQITSPGGMIFDASACGSAYRLSEGRIEIGIRYAEKGRWKIMISGTPDEGFRLVVSTNCSFGEYAGSTLTEETPVPDHEVSSVPPVESTVSSTSAQADASPEAVEAVQSSAEQTEAASDSQRCPTVTSETGSVQPDAGIAPPEEQPSSICTGSPANAENTSVQKMNAIMTPTAIPNSLAAEDPPAAKTIAGEPKEYAAKPARRTIADGIVLLVLAALFIFITVIVSTEIVRDAKRRRKKRQIREKRISGNSIPRRAKFSLFGKIPGHFFR